MCYGIRETKLVSEGKLRVNGQLRVKTTSLRNVYKSVRIAATSSPYRIIQPTAARSGGAGILAVLQTSPEKCWLMLFLLQVMLLVLVLLLLLVLLMRRVFHVNCWWHLQWPLGQVEDSRAATLHGKYQGVEIWRPAPKHNKTTQQCWKVSAVTCNLLIRTDVPRCFSGIGTSTYTNCVN